MSEETVASRCRARPSTPPPNATRSPRPCRSASPTCERGEASTAVTKITAC